MLIVFWVFFFFYTLRRLPCQIKRYFTRYQSYFQRLIKIDSWDTGEVFTSDQIFFFLFATRHCNFYFIIDFYCLLLCSLLTLSFMSQARFLLASLINDNVSTSSSSFCDHQNNHRAAPCSLLLVQRALVLIALSPLPFSLYGLQPPPISLVSSLQSPPQNPPLSLPIGSSLLSLKRNHLFPVSLVSNPDLMIVSFSILDMRFFRFLCFRSHI